MKKPRQRIADAASRPGDAESRPWMACGGESGLDACRAEEHAPVGTTLCPKPAQRPPAWIFPSPRWAQNKKRRHAGAGLLWGLPLAGYQVTTLRSPGQIGGRKTSTR